MVVIIAGIHILQEIFAIDVLRALKPSLKHDRKHVLRLLRIYGDQDGLHISRKDRKHMVANMFSKLFMNALVFT